jgi:hypothetical protein
MLRNQAPEQRAAEAERSRQRLATATPEQRAAATERKRQWRVANPTKAKAEAARRTPEQRAAKAERERQWRAAHPGYFTREQRQARERIAWDRWLKEHPDSRYNHVS